MDAMFKVRAMYDQADCGAEIKAEAVGDPGFYREVAVSVHKDGECIGDVYVSVLPNGTMRVLITADGEGDGDHKIAVYPRRSAEMAVEIGNY